MQHKNYFISLLLLLAALTATAQTPCPGPPNRTALINLQRSNLVNGTRAYQMVMTDTCGNQRYVLLDSLIVLVVDSIQADSTLQRNWYTHNGVTTDNGRTAFVKRTAWWRALDTLGFFRFTFAPTLFEGTQTTQYRDSLIFEYFSGDVTNYIGIADTGITIATTGDEARSVNVRTDTVNWSSSLDPTLQIHNLLADGTYFYADSLKVVGIGQFPDFPSINFDGRDKGFFYKTPFNVTIVNGDGSTGSTAQSEFTPEGIESTVISDASFLGVIQTGMTAQTTELNATHIFTFSNSTHADTRFNIDVSQTENIISFWHTQKDTNNGVFLYFGEGNNAIPYDGRRAFGVRTDIDEVVAFDWLQSYLPNDTTENAVSFYNRAYYWRNEHPIGAAGDTLFHFWAATGPGGEAGRDPGFMTLDDIRGSGVNWYNANGTTTDNTRIATVTETATWLSDDVVQDGVYPFRFQLAGVSPNEPEMMVWDFPTDSVTLSQSDQELILFANNFFVFKSDQAITIQADSFSYNPNLGGVGFRVGANNVVTQNSIVGSPTHKDAIASQSITGTAQTEIFLDGAGGSAVWVIPTNSSQTFKVHVAAICSSAGNGIGINTGDAYASWSLGGIKRVGSATSLVGTVQDAATAQADAGMSTSVVTIDADDSDESLRIRFTPPSTAGSSTVIQVTATIEVTQTSY